MRLRPVQAGIFKESLESLAYRADSDNEEGACFLF